MKSARKEVTRDTIDCPKYNEPAAVRLTINRLETGSGEIARIKCPVRKAHHTPQEDCGLLCIPTFNQKYRCG